MRIAEKWDGRMPGVGHGGGDWKQRARRAEAESEAWHAVAHSKELQREARERELQRELDSYKKSFSWRMTSPLRKLNLWRRGAAGKLERPPEP